MSTAVPGTEAAAPQQIELHGGSRTTIELPGGRTLSVLQGFQGQHRLWVLEFTAADKTQQRMVLPDDAVRALAGVQHSVG